MKRLARLLMPIVVAGVLGPLVAGLIFCLLALYTYVVDPTGTSVADLLTMSGIYIAFAYFEGGPIALLAGLLVSIRMIRRPPGLVVAVAAAIIAVGLFRLAAQIGLLSPSGGSLVVNNFALTLAVSVVAACVCWLLMRRFATTA